MADHEKVISVSFDTTKAQQSIKKLESMLEGLRARTSKAIGSGGLDKMAATAAKVGRSVKSGLGAADAAALKTRQQFEKSTASMASGTARVSRGFHTITAAEEKARQAGAALDSILKRATKDGEAGAKKMARAMDVTAKAAQKTDESIAKMNARRGERQKAAALRAIERRIRGIGSSARIANISVGGMLAKIGLFIGAASKIREVVTDWLDFDRVMITASAKFSKLEPEMAPGTAAFANLRKEMREASRETEHTAAGVARTVDFWAKAGKSSEITRASIPATLDFASANTDAAGAVLDVARAGDILSDVLGQFRLNSTNAETHMANLARVSDVMSAAANQANFSADELFESFKGSGPILKMVGSDIEETSALLAVMANAGIKGSIAGTQLKMAVANLSAPTGRQEAALKALGVTLKDSEGNFRGLTAIIGDLNRATSQMGSADRAAIISDIIGRRALPAFVNLLSEGQQNLDAMTEKLRAANGETKRLAEIIRSSASAQMQRFWNKVTDLGFTIIENTKLFDKLGKAVDGIDWEKAAAFVTDKMVPALVKTGDFIANVLWPGFKHGAELLEQIFTPALWLVEKAFGAAADGGDGLATAIGVLIAAWGAYRGALVALRAIDMIAYFASLVKGAAAATVGQQALTAATAEGTAAMGAATAAAGALNIALGVVAAGVAGWTIGSIIYKELIEPLQNAADAARKFDEEYRHSRENENNQNRTKGVLESDLSIAEKKLRGQESGFKFTADEMAAFKGKRPEDFTSEQKMRLVKDKTKNIRFEAFQKFSEQQDTRDYINRTRNRIAVKNTEANVSKYGADQSNPENYQSIPQSGSVTDYEEDFSPGSFQMPEPIRVPIIATPEAMTIDPNNLVNWSGDEMSVPIAYPDPAIFKTGRSEMPIQEPFSLETSGAADQYSEIWQNMLTAQQQTADYQKQMVDAALKAPEGNKRTVNQTNNITQGSTTINAPGVDPKEIERILRRRDRENDRNTRDALDQYLADAEETEF